MSYQSNIERIIKEAERRGEFDNLPGKGKPQKLEDDYLTPPHLRMAYTVLKNSGFVPEEVSLFREIEALQKQLETCEDQQEKKVIVKKIQDKEMKIKLFLESMRNDMP